MFTIIEKKETPQKNTIIRDISFEDNCTFNLKVNDIYQTTKSIPYNVLEQGIKDIISNWNQSQKENQKDYDLDI